MFKLSGKRLVWGKWFRIFTDSGQPKFYYIPRIINGIYHERLGMSRFRMYWLGKEFNFSFGEDKHGLYTKRNQICQK